MRDRLYRMIAALAAGVLLAAGCAGASPDLRAGEAVTADAGVVESTTPAAVTTPVSREGNGRPAHGGGILECRYYDEREFSVHISRAEIYGTEGTVMCGVAPHHLTAGHMIAGLYKTAALRRKNTDTVIICAPRHYDSANVLITSYGRWRTPFGMLETDEDVTDVLCEELGAAEDDGMMQYDHSISSHIPYVKYYFPGAKVACLMVSPDAGNDFPGRLAETLQGITEKKDCLVIFSIDFSHYLTPYEAEENDKETRTAVLEGDTDTIMRFGNDNVDTPYCLTAFVKLSGLLGGTITEADHGNSFTIGELPYNSIIFPDGVTSYFVWLTG